MIMADRSFRTIGLVGVGLLCGLVVVRTIAGPTNSAVRETVLARIPATAGGGKPLVSSDNRQVAFPVMHRGKWCVSLNGVESELYTSVSELTFSPDGKRLAFAARRELSRNLVVLDGKEGAEYEYLPDSLTFSPDSRRLAFLSGNSKASFVLLDGKPGPDFEMLCAGLDRRLFFFSPDGQKLAYGGKRKAPDGGMTTEVVIESKHREIIPAADNAIVDGFSPDGQHLAWSVQRSNRWQVIVDGKTGPLFDQIGEGSFRFSSNSQHTAYFANQGGSWMGVLDGKTGPPFDAIGDDAPVLSTDGRRWAYVGVRGKQRLVVMNGQEGAAYDGVDAGSLQFSPDGQHVAFGAVRGLRHFVVRDGKEQEAGDAGLRMMFFSPDSRHLAYAAAHNGRARVFVDDKPGKDYDGLADKWACFSPDSKHLAYGAARDKMLVLVLDDQEFGVYEGNLGTLVFEGPNILCGVVTRLDEKFNFEVVRLEIQVTSK